MIKPIAPLFCTALLFMFSVACKKKETVRNGYDYSEVYKNSLSVAVELHRGTVWGLSADRDTLVFLDTIKIAPHSVYEKKQFICTADCEYMRPQTSVMEMRELAKVYIDGKQRSDTACNTYQYFHRDEPSTGNCVFKGPNIYDPARWSAMQDPAGNTVRREYVFDETDLQSVK